METQLRLKKLWIFMAWCLVSAVIILSLGSPPPMPSVSHSDKVGHVLAYFVLMGWISQIYHEPRQRFFYALIFLLLGGSLEYLQSLTANREGDWMDMLANSLGVFMGWLFTHSRMGYVLAYCEQRWFKILKS